MSNAVDIINENLDIMKILEHYNFEHISQKGHYIRSACTIHGGHNPTAFVFNLENNLWYCHTECNKGGDVYDLISELEDISFIESVQKASQILGIDIEGIEIKERPDKWVMETKKWIQYMKNKNKNKNKKELHLDDICVCMYDVKKFRNFNNDTLLRFGLKYIKEFKYINKEEKEVILKDRLLYPIYYSEKLVMVLLRTTKADDKPKWFNYPPDVKSGEVLYNYDEAVKYMKENKIRDIVIVEGIHDVWAYYEAGIYNVVATFGSNLTDEQAKLLYQIAEGLYISYDNDTAGIIGTNKIIEAHKDKMNIRVIELEEGKDPAEHEREELKERYNNKISYKRWLDKYGQIIRTIKNAKRTK